MPRAGTCYDEIIDMVAAGTTPSGILSFDLSPETKQRVDYLRAGRGNAILTEDEIRELEQFDKFEQFLHDLKTRALLYVKD
ncbi:MAG: hypothetical protein ACKV2V_16975 [Blastocatellia bacterium]